MSRAAIARRSPSGCRRCRLTRRLREQAGPEITERGITPAEAARHAGVSWPVAFAAAADPVLEQAPAPVAHLGIDEHRRGRPRWRIDEQAGEYLLLAGRWHTCFFDLSGEQGLLGQVEGRTAVDAAYWLARAAAEAVARLGTAQENEVPGLDLRVCPRCRWGCAAEAGWQVTNCEEAVMGSATVQGQRWGTGPGYWAEVI